MKKFISLVLDTIKYTIAPPYCFYCRAFMDDYRVLCSPCVDYIKPIPSTKLNLTKGSTMTVHAIGEYRDPLKSLILAKLWSDYTASKQLAYLMWHYSALKHIDFDYLVPIPLHWTRYAHRGYNQAQILAQELARLSGKPMLVCIKRIRRTMPQSSTVGLERKRNVSGAFELTVQDIQEYQGKIVVLVDDVMTTGATLEAAGKLLIALQPAAIHAIVACRVPWILKILLRLV
jgi:competence protein ComFC